jgi:hypothetical protein
MGIRAMVAHRRRFANISQSKTFVLYDCQPRRHVARFIPLFSQNRVRGLQCAI